VRQDVCRRVHPTKAGLRSPAQDLLPVREKGRDDAVGREDGKPLLAVAGARRTRRVLVGDVVREQLRRVRGNDRRGCQSLMAFHARTIGRHRGPGDVQNYLFAYPAGNSYAHAVRT
jgi:hypothetical protein